MLRSCRLWLPPSFLPPLPPLASTLFCLLPHHCSLPQLRALFIACSGSLSPTWRAPAFTSFSRKVALESEKDIDRISRLSPSPGPGAPRRELDPDSALHTGSRLHAGPRPTPARLRRLLPSLSPGSLPLTSALPLPSLSLSRLLCHSRPLPSRFSPTLSISLFLLSTIPVLFIGVSPTVLPSTYLFSLLRSPTLRFFLYPLSRKRTLEHPPPQAEVAKVPAGLWSLERKVLIPRPQLRAPAPSL